MKLLSLALFLVTSSAFAGFAPTTTCSNADATVTISLQKNAVVYKSPRPDAFRGQIAFDKLDFEVGNIIEIEKEVSGCTSREVSIKQIRITKKSGEKMPDAYNRNATKNGALQDIFICIKKTAWMGNSCPPVIE